MKNSISESRELCKELVQIAKSRHFFSKMGELHELNLGILLVCFCISY